MPKPYKEPLNKRLDREYGLLGGFAKFEKMYLDPEKSYMDILSHFKVESVSTIWRWAKQYESEHGKIKKG